MKGTQTLTNLRQIRQGRGNMNEPKQFLQLLWKLRHCEGAPNCSSHQVWERVRWDRHKEGVLTQTEALDGEMGKVLNQLEVLLEEGMQLRQPQLGVAPEKQGGWELSNWQCRRIPRESKIGTVLYQGETGMWGSKEDTDRRERRKICQGYHEKSE